MSGRNRTLVSGVSALQYWILLPRKRTPYGQWSPDARALDVIGGKWTLLIVRDLSAGSRRFVELQRSLPGISTEQLRIRLAEMVADGLLERRRYREVPPRVVYSLTPRGEDLRRVLGEISGWGLRWTWGPPRGDERLDFDALLRTLTTLPVPSKTPSGVLALRVGNDTFACEIRKGSCRLLAERPDRADATISGSESTWVQALSPASLGKGMRISGDRQLAKAFIGLAARQVDPPASPTRRSAAG
jgi:DNA-binding HxlR family transcriptional regulator